MRWTEQNLTDHLQRYGVTSPTSKASPGPKFGNKRTEVNGRTFDSKLEASRWSTLELLQQLGEIRDLQAQVRFPLMVGEHLISLYVADAVYFDVKANRKVVEDSKGIETAVFKLKAKHFRAQYGFDILVVKKR